MLMLAENYHLQGKFAQAKSLFDKLLTVYQRDSNGDGPKHLETFGQYVGCLPCSRRFGQTGSALRQDH